MITVRQYLSVVFLSNITHFEGNDAFDILRNMLIYKNSVIDQTSWNSSSLLCSLHTTHTVQRTCYWENLMVVNWNLLLWALFLRLLPHVKGQHTHPHAAPVVKTKTKTYWYTELWPRWPKSNSLNTQFLLLLLLLLIRHNNGHVTKAALPRPLCSPFCTWTVVSDDGLMMIIMIWTQSGCHWRRFNFFMFSYLCLFWQNYFFIPNRHNHHQSIIRHNAAV